MLEKSYSRHEFGQTLARLVSPAHPVESIENLFGREEELSRIEKALYASGRHVFIFGERGVGKSSLAATAANQWQSSDNSYIDISCAPDSTIGSIIAAIVGHVLERNHLKATDFKKRLSIGAKWLNYTIEQSSRDASLATEITSVSDAVEILRELAQIHSESVVVVVDEVDRMASPNDVSNLADLIKQLGDKRVNIKFIFTGVGESLGEILGQHSSAFRQLETVELPRLSWDGRWAIAIHALSQFRVEIDRSIYIRIAAVSDGFPYYVHLIVEKLLWILFESSDLKRKVEWNDYFQAVDHAIAGISAELARPYERAVIQRSRDYELIVWATAADEWQGASLTEMYDQYSSIVEAIDEEDNPGKLSYQKFCSRVRNLQKDDYGSILRKGKRPGFYHYNEKMLRGYVRLQAEAHGIQIRGKDPIPSQREFMKVPAKSRGYRSSHPPKGVKLK